MEDQNTILYRMVCKCSFFPSILTLYLFLFFCTCTIDVDLMILHLVMACHQIHENQQVGLGGEVKLGDMAPLAMLPPAAAFAPPHSAAACYYAGESSSTALQLTPEAPQQLHPVEVGFRLQPTQPNLQDPACSGLHGHGLQLW